MSVAARILVVDDEALARDSLTALLSREGHEVLAVGDGFQVEGIVRERRPDLVLLDLRLPGVDGLSLLRRLWELPDAPSVILMTAYGTSETAIEAMKCGAFDYITKPINFDEFQVLIRRALEYRRLCAEVEALRENYTAAVGLPNMVGNSPAMQAVYKMIGRVAPSETTILIRGESGTGKELVAEAIHAHSRRSRGPLVKVNCAAIPEGLLESELFGYEKGAFTDARQRHLGRFEQASGGTIFLDEVGELGAATQAKLLRVLQDSTFERLGGDTIRADVRVLAATGGNLEEAVRAGRLRQDLYYRLNVVTISIPPLRERRHDIPELVERLLQKHEARQQVSSPGLTRDAFVLLLGYDWPGNVRQLENVLQRALVLARNRPITHEFIHLETSLAPTTAPSGSLRLDPARGFKETVAEVEKKLIFSALAATGGNRSRAASLLRIQRRLLYSKMQEYGIQDREGPTVPWDNTGEAPEE